MKKEQVGFPFERHFSEVQHSHKDGLESLIPSASLVAFSILLVELDAGGTHVAQL